MMWVLHLIGSILGVFALMHRLAIAASDPTCYRFVRLVNDWPAPGMGAAERAVLLEGAARIGECWLTQGVRPAPAAPAIVINMPAQAPPLPHVSTALLVVQDRYRNSIGKLDAQHQAVYTVIMALPSTVMQTQALLAIITAHADNAFAVLTDAQVLCLTNGGVLEAANLNVPFVDKMMRALNPRLPPGLPTELEALTQAAEWVTTFVNRRLGVLIAEFIPRSLKKMRTCAPDLMTPSSLIDFVREFLLTHVSPAITNATAVGDVYDAVAAAATENLLDQTVVNTLVRFEYRARHAADVRGHNGAPTGGSQRANPGAGGGGSGARAPPREGENYHDPPPNKTRPDEYTAELPRYPQPKSKVVLCFPSRSTMGRCPYATCNRQHDWANVTVPEQLLVKDWLKLWLAKQRWTQFVKWSDTGGTPGTWPAICG